MSDVEKLMKIIKYLNETRPENLKVVQKNSGGCLEICRSDEEPPQ